jgi:DNA-binding MarR family transcriptional regulator
MLPWQRFGMRRVGKPYYQVGSFEGRRSLGYLIRRLHNLVMPRAEALFADADFTFTQWVVLIALRDGIATTCAEIARHMDHDAGATTRIIDEMESRGLIERKRSTKDRRVVRLAVTPAGRALAQSLMPRIVDFWNTTLEGFSQAEFRQLVELMTRLIILLEAQPVQPAKTKAAP